MNTTEKGILILLRSGITGESLTLPGDFSLEAAHPVLKKHSVLSLAYQGAVNCGLDKKDPTMQKMLMEYYRILMRHEKQTRDLERLFAAFEERGIPYMPLKGCNIKKLYPKPELRSMGDADILIHVEDYPRISIMMEGLGLQLKEEDDHVYTWYGENLLVELHKTLVRPAEEDFYRHYGTGWQLAEKGPGSRHDLSREEEYVFTFVHLTKHYRSMGIGLRHFLDLYVYRRVWPNLDMLQVSRELDKLGLLEFHGHVMDTLDVWFAGAGETPVSQLITGYVFASGNWGKLDTYYLTQAAKSRGRQSGTRAMIRALFPDRTIMERYYPVLARHPALLPVYWVVRWFAIVLHRRKNIRRKLRIITSVDDTATQNRREALKMVGLDV